MASKFFALLVTIAVLLISTTSLAQQSCQGGTCVPKEDMKAILEVIKEKKCLSTETPKFDLDPITIVIDKDKRVFFSGSAPLPYKLKMKWCSYEVSAEGQVKLTAAVQEPEQVGFRLRPKAYFGVLLAEPFRTDLKSSLDGGLMVDFFHYQDWNLNASVGVRSVGAGIGVDVFRSFGLFGGYAFSYQGRHNPVVSAWFSFW